jgi:ABC-type transport system involved in cytochrome c biogenesis permease component
MITAHLKQSPLCLDGLYETNRQNGTFLEECQACSDRHNLYVVNKNTANALIIFINKFFATSCSILTN